MAMTDLELDIDRVRNDPSASFWLKRSLDAALTRDPVDAASDAEALADILKRRADQLLGLPTDAPAQPSQSDVQLRLTP